MEATVLQVTQKYQLVDESFSQGMVDRAILLAILDEERFTYCILDAARQKVVVLKEYRIIPKTKEGLATHFIEQVLEQDEALSSLTAEKIIFAVHETSAWRVGRVGKSGQLSRSLIIYEERLNSRRWPATESAVCERVPPCKPPAPPAPPSVVTFGLRVTNCK